MMELDGAAKSLAVRMRPTKIDELIGQEHLTGPGSPLRNLIEGTSNLSLILWGPPGTGKTTIAGLVAKGSTRRYREISAVTSGVKDLREELDAAKMHLRTGVETTLFIDEVHRFSKAQQDLLLPAVENQWVTLIAATTENPSFSIITPLLSRSILLTLKPLNNKQLETLVVRALENSNGLENKFILEDDALATLIRMGGGDARKTLTVLDAAATVAQSLNTTTITLDVLEKAVDAAFVQYDKSGEQHYDVTSAFIKSIRGGDTDAALHYLARMIEGGEDPRFIARRLMILASEDIGVADPTALTIAVNASYVLEKVGMPEARLALAQATIQLSLAPKSNSTIVAINAAQQDIKKGFTGAVPPHLRDGHYPGAKDLGHGSNYLYPHDYPEGIVKQQYMPDELKDKFYYHPKNTGLERSAVERVKWLQTKLGKIFRK